MGVGMFVVCLVGTCTELLVIGNLNGWVVGLKVGLEVGFWVRRLVGCSVGWQGHVGSGVGKGGGIVFGRVVRLIMGGVVALVGWGVVGIEPGIGSVVGRMVRVVGGSCVAVRTGFLLVGIVGLGVGLCVLCEWGWSGGMGGLLVVLLVGGMVCA